jgi:hypothetical protein
LKLPASSHQEVQGKQIFITKYCGFETMTLIDVASLNFNAMHESAGDM